jgi:hypothetical protein
MRYNVFKYFKYFILICIFIINSFVIFQAKKYQINNKILVLYGISQNPDTNDYILVFNWTSGSDIIDDFIQKKQLEVIDYNNIVFEWIPYSQFNEIEKTGKNNLITVYSAVWKDGPLYKKNMWNTSYTRDSNKKVALKCLYNSKNSVEFVINEV